MEQLTMLCSHKSLKRAALKIEIGRQQQWCQTFKNNKIAKAFSYFKDLQVLGYNLS